MEGEMRWSLFIFYPSHSVSSYLYFFLLPTSFSHHNSLPSILSLYTLFTILAFSHSTFENNSSLYGAHTFLTQPMLLLFFPFSHLSIYFSPLTFVSFMFFFTLGYDFPFSQYFFLTNPQLSFSSFHHVYPTMT
ncbi:hypothetical protein L6164_012138 [Bauhinia variegata]|uniref:Uncharacterized protein n=1 Tax=Bauhinia variegata TaxID=167791 RepID=A0ACB9P9F3_BAUVA|nr:hypothetical protein L6164_012138 [Bauhinia variegata]